MRTVALEAHNLTKVYPNGTVGVEDLSLTVHKGEVIGLLGPNGSGKTTTVNLFTTAFPPTKGSAKVMGYDIVADRDRVRRAIAVVSQQDTVNWWLTVYQNIDLFASLLGMPRKTRQREIDRFLGEFELDGKRDHYLDDLSSGQIRRVQVVRALLYHPQVLFVDEPTLGLDPVGVRKVLIYLKSLSRDGVTIVLATNEMDQVEEVCDRVVFLSKGRLLDQGRTADFTVRYAGCERVEVLYRGAVPDKLESWFAENEEQYLESLQPLVYSGRHAGRKLCDVLSFLMEDGVEVEDITIKKPGLTGAFIEIVQGEHRG
ncbi:MAG: Daunorubicin/doxorubicin resistance ATP-binding protein DrrA [Dehalococcoidia bacterium]|nr:Daunorubicin/doxorubicin resistance ATP-binding protein DrrA [Bacillota bacterium]MBT9143420.1 Daunorubicin/doxorubicin resistance ATP-binding protein DrrA [Bacillota bacterium]